ncbi:DUF748 domain-containing protein [Panacibacter ginsenosidivorans]|uniref:DUF748 domain-containing protein n=1 Tax=Panacibacter ginsenosidivorans TaxID=1813871 RepID=A0A5B8V7Y5_9BACT|nr:DUF748 domain-containing protein [Panacibacter ginsenosidivorans]QEC66488.1 DUF748 domain-containing protein [Panacibacter ginsenosidivorans]
MHTKKKKIWIRWMISLTALLLLLVVGNMILKSILKKRLYDLTKQFQPVANAGYSDVHISLLSGSIDIDSLSIKYHPDTAHKKHTHDLYFPVLHIGGINYFKLISGKNFSASLLQLKNGRIKLDPYLYDKKDSVSSRIFSAIKLPFENLFFDKVELLNTTVQELNDDKQEDLLNGEIILEDLYVAHLGADFSADSIHFSNVQCALTDVNYALPGYHTVHIKKIALNSKDSTLLIDSVNLIPDLGKFQLGQKLHHQADHIRATVSSVKVDGLDVMKLRKKKFIAANLNINQSVVYVFRDRRLPRLMKQQPTSADYLKMIPADVYISHFKLTDATVTSEEFPKKGNQTGFIKIAHISISMQPFFNRQDKNNKSVLTASVKGSIMNAGNIHASIDLDLPTGNEDIKGAIEDLHLTALNPSAENLGQFHIESGVLDHLSFNFSANSKKAKGEIIGAYHDLVIDKLKNNGKENKTAWLPTFALHNFIIPKTKDASTPVKKRTGKIDYDRDPTRLVTFFYIKALLDGIRDSFSLGFLLPE